MSNPLPHAQEPFEQVAPLPQALPQAPQFCESLPFTLMHWPLQFVWPAPQVTPVPPVPEPPVPPVPVVVEGVAQLAAKSARPKQATSADKKGLRTVMLNSFN